LANKRFKSKFEQQFALDLEDKGIPYEYEKITLPFTQEHKYYPDFDLGGVMLIETKGRFTGRDRAKHLKVKEAHPDRDIRFVFMKASNKLSTKSKTTYSEWCDKHGFKWAEGRIPEEWQEEVRKAYKGKSYPTYKGRSTKAKKKT